MAGNHVKTLGTGHGYIIPCSMPGLSMWSLAGQLNITCFSFLLPPVSCRQISLGTALKHTARELSWNALVPAGRKGCGVWCAVLRGCKYSDFSSVPGRQTVLDECGSEERASMGACVWSTWRHMQMQSCYFNSTPGFVLGSSKGDQLVRDLCSSQ